VIYMFCYDISDDKRLRKTSKFLENYGLRIQYSFFQCEISRDNVEKIIKGVKKIINKREDSFFVYPLCNKCTKKAQTDGEGHIIKLEPFDIF